MRETITHPSVRNYNYYKTAEEVEPTPDLRRSVGLFQKLPRKLAAGTFALVFGLAPAVSACGDSDPVTAKPQANASAEAGTGAPTLTPGEELADLRNNLDEEIRKQAEKLASTSIDPYHKKEEDVLLELNGKMDALANAGTTPEILTTWEKMHNLPNLTTEDLNSLPNIIAFGNDVSGKITKELAQNEGFFDNVDDKTMLALQAIRANRITCGLVGEMNGNHYTANFHPVEQTQPSSYNYSTQGYVRFENESTTSACTNDDGQNYEHQNLAAPFRDVFHFIYRQVNEKGRQSYKGHGLRLTTAELMKIEPFEPMDPVKY